MRRVPAQSVASNRRLDRQIVWTVLFRGPPVLNVHVLAHVFGAAQVPDGVLPISWWQPAESMTKSDGDAPESPSRSLSGLSGVTHDQSSRKRTASLDAVPRQIKANVAKARKAAEPRHTSTSVEKTSALGSLGIALPGDR